VALLDTRVAWSAPIYEDLAYFLTASKTPRALVASYRQWSADRLIERSIAERLAELGGCEVAA
jgi:hypothetical protein